MLQEVELDQSKGKIYITERLSPTGKQNWVGLLQQAIMQHNDAWLANELPTKNRFNSTEPYKTKAGIAKMRNINIPHVTDLLASSEFNKFYIRGPCVYAVNNNIDNLVVYRARHSKNPRPESQRKVGTKVNPSAILQDLRANIGYETILKLPEINSGLSAKLPS